MKVVSVEQMRELDRRTIEEFETAGEVLMARAGAGVARVVCALIDRRRLRGRMVRCYAGKGNNGGDAFVAARLLKEQGIETEICLAGVRGEVRGDARLHLDRMLAAGVPLCERPEPEQWGEPDLEPAGILVDGLLGTGTRGAPRGAVLSAIREINCAADDALVVSIDTPSGLDADTGETAGEAVVADVTVTLGLPKRGLVLPMAVEHVGNLEVVDIGIPTEYTDDLTGDLEFISRDDVRGGLARRPRASHKGTYGHVLIIGGSPGFTGAVGLAARAALRSGAGLVSVLVPEAIMPVTAGMAPEAMVHPGRQAADGGLAADCLERWSRALSDFDAVLVGPGLGVGEEAQGLVQAVLRDCTRPLVLDADALNACASRPESVARAQCPVVVTPHPGEMGRLLGVGAAEIQADRLGAAVRAAETLGATVVLKGAGTLVSRAGEPVGVSLAGNPGLASGGTGDVLAGLLAGLLAQGLDERRSACAAVFIHGRAGDRAALERTQQAMTAGDVVDRIPAVLSEMVIR